MRIHLSLRFLLGLLVFASLGIFLLYSIDNWIDRKSKDAALEVGLTQWQGNTAKHAFAAGKLFLIFRSIGFSENLSKRWVYALGVVNEWVEHHTTPKRDRDYTAEMMKDLLNNLCGVEIAIAWSKKQKDMSTEDYLRHLALLTKTGILPLSWRDSRIPYADYPESSIDANLHAAVTWFYREEVSLTASLKEELEIVQE